MSDSEHPSPSPPSRKLPIIPIVLIALLLGFALFGDKGILRALQYSRQKHDLETEIRQQVEISTELRREIEALRNDLGTIEGIARRELGMVKEDELVYQFPPRSGDTQSAPSAGSPLPAPSGVESPLR